MIWAAPAVKDLDAHQTRDLDVEQKKSYKYNDYPSVEGKQGGHNNYESYVS